MSFKVVALAPLTHLAHLGWVEGRYVVRVFEYDDDDDDDDDDDNDDSDIVCLYKRTLM